MSLAHFVSLQKEIPNFDHFVNGKAIAHASDKLDAIAKKINVTSIMDFYGRKWHQAETGIETVNALVKYLTEHPTSVNDVDEVIEDLKEWEQVLLRAKKENIKWKMKIDY